MSKMSFLASRSGLLVGAIWLIALDLACSHHAPSTSTTKPAVVATTRPIDPVTARIRDEGLNHSQVMETLDYMCNDIGPRLTGSPGCKRASEWTRDTLESWALSNAHLEPWGPFGRGWSVQRFSMQVTEPYTILLNAYPRAWSPGFDEPIEAHVVWLDARKDQDLEKYKGKLNGAIVLIGQPRDVQARFDPLASRISDADLAKMASAQPGSNLLMGQPRDQTASERRAQFESSAVGDAMLNRRRAMGDGNGDTTRPAATQPTSRPGGRRNFDPFAARALEFVTKEGAVLAITPSMQGDGGTIFVQQASIPGEQPRFGGSGPSTEPSTGPSTRPRVWSTSAPTIPPQVTLAVEDYNRLVHMLKRDEKLKMAVDLKVKFFDEDQMAYNTIAEIPGSDPYLKDQIVMVGAHLDSWHSGTGATDNGVGSAAAMEAIRILKALDLHPRRTIRVALWTGEEQGIFGSEAYVKKHFGYEPESPRRGGASQPATRRARNIVKEADYENLSAYFNLDNGTGKIRGIYAQGNEPAVPIFKKWLAPFADLGATTVSIANTGSTDHISFDTIGLPGFQFIQDPIEYGSRTHHSNEDVYDRAQADDLKQASTIMASFLWNAANMNERFPRKALDTPTAR